MTTLYSKELTMQRHFHFFTPLHSLACERLLRPRSKHHEQRSLLFTLAAARSVGAAAGTIVVVGGTFDTSQ